MREKITFHFDDQEVPALRGQSVAAALMAAGIKAWRKAEDGGPRGMLCGIGVCWECRLVINDHPNRRACMVLAQSGMKVRHQEGLG